MLAIVSDIHANLEAFTAVLEEIDRRGITDILCLGDIIGRGPNPVECLDLVMSRCRVTLLGNHDFAALYEPFNFVRSAERSCYWTRRCFEDQPDPVRCTQRWRFLANLPMHLRTPEFAAFHASPRRPVNEYIFPDDIFTNPGKFKLIFQRFEKICFVGHTHVPGVFLEGPDFYPPAELGDQFEARHEKAIVNVGSVGQPRDGDLRSSFVVLTDSHVEFVRVPYDVATTVKKIREIKELEMFIKGYTGEDDGPLA